MCVLFFMMQTDDKMLFSREKAINCFIIASSYVAARAMFYGQATFYEQISTFGACLNPAIALGLILGSVFSGATWRLFASLWIYPIMPLLGAVVALIFFELVYKKTTEVLEHDDGEKVEDALLDN